MKHPLFRQGIFPDEVGKLDGKEEDTKSKRIAFVFCVAEERKLVSLPLASRVSVQQMVLGCEFIRPLSSRSGQTAGKFRYAFL